MFEHVYLFPRAAMHTSMTRLVLLILLLICTGPRVLTAQIGQSLLDDAFNCDPQADSISEDQLEAPYIVMSTIGQKIKSAGLPISEADDLNVYLYGDPSATSQIFVRRSSPTRAEQVRFGGLAAKALRDGAAPDCQLRKHVLMAFAPGEGKFVLEVADGNEIKQVGREVTFLVRRLIRGIVSFGPLASTLGDYTYEAVAETDGTFTLSELGDNLSLDYAFSFTYYLTGARARDESTSIGLFLAIPVTGTLGDTAYAGLSVDVGTVLVLQGGVRLGKVSRLVDTQQDLLNTMIPSDFTITTENRFIPAFTFGISIDAAAATKAFGNTIAALGS